ncbi:MAG: hypothetical protein GDA39_05915 [Hyphomonadaceae bacterium]|nr:hypothetical protein [Hyphomonadaceae bacterium]
MKWATFRSIMLAAVVGLGLSACGGGGGGGGDVGTLPGTPPGFTRDTAAPVVSFSPDLITVPPSGGDEELQVVVTDNVRIDRGSVRFVIDCDESMLTGAGSYSVEIEEISCRPTIGNGVRCSMEVSIPRSGDDPLGGGLTCEVGASDTAGNTGRATFTVTIMAPDTEAPVVTFSPARINVNAGATGSTTLAARDNVDVVRGPAVTR